MGISDTHLSCRSLHIKTPLIESCPLSQIRGGRVFLKMENLQPSGSFKLRGIGNLCQNGVARGVSHFVSSSGGNAGYAAAYSGRMLNIPTTVFVPTTTPALLQRKIESQGAHIRIVGDVWDETHEAALRFAESIHALYVSPFDHPLIWAGHSTIVDEILDDMGIPDLIVLSVGGGGLLCGVIEGLRRHGLTQTPIVAVETEGTASLSASLRAGKLTTLESIQGIAKSLGAKTVARSAFEWSRQHPVQSVVVTDVDSIVACVRFADDHRCLVEPACGASLSVAYARHPALVKSGRIVVIVCGGIGVTLDMLHHWLMTPET